MRATTAITTRLPNSQIKFEAFKVRMSTDILERLGKTAWIRVARERVHDRARHTGLYRLRNSLEVLGIACNDCDSAVAKVWMRQDPSNADALGMHLVSWGSRYPLWS